MKTKKILLAALAVMCAMTATSVFTACGDDEVTVSSGYSYYVKYYSGISTDLSEENSLEAQFKSAMGFANGMYPVYSDKQDELMMNKCKAIQDEFNNRQDIRSLYMMYTLFRINTVQGGDEELGTFVLGKCVKTPYAKFTMDFKYDKEALKAIGDSLLALKTPEDSLKWDTYLDASNNSMWNMQVAFSNDPQLKEIMNKYMKASELDGYKDLLDSIASAHNNDSLLVDCYFNATKTTIPEGKKEIFWQKTFKANLK